MELRTMATRIARLEAQGWNLCAEFERAFNNATLKRASVRDREDLLFSVDELVSMTGALRCKMRDLLRVF